MIAEDLRDKLFLKLHLGEVFIHKGKMEEYTLGRYTTINKKGSSWCIAQ